MDFFDCMICNGRGSAKKLDDINTLWGDRLWQGFPVCSDCVPLIKHLVGWNYWDRNKEKIHADYFKLIMESLKEQEKEGIERFL